MLLEIWAWFASKQQTVKFTVTENLQALILIVYVLIRTLKNYFAHKTVFL